MMLNYAKNDTKISYKRFYSKFLQEYTPTGYVPYSFALSIETLPPICSIKLTRLYKHSLNIIANLFQRADIVNVYSEYQEVLKKILHCVLHEDFDINTFMKVTDDDYHIQAHSINVAVYAIHLGVFLKLEEKQLLELGEAALFHDLGKRNIDKKIVNKEGKLSSEEFQKMKAHSVIGYNISRQIGIHNKNVLDGIRFHHEKMDGSGYPYGLKGDKIPLYARIIGICDAFDALTTNRCYGNSVSSFEALMLISNTMRNQVDMNLLKQMIMMFQKLEA